MTQIIHAVCPECKQLTNLTDDYSFAKTGLKVLSSIFSFSKVGIVTNIAMDTVGTVTGKMAKILNVSLVVR